MLLAALISVEKYYGEQEVLAAANLELRSGSRTALIGRNGSGKTTVLRLLMGEEIPDGGSVYRADGATFALLDQDPVFDSTDTVLDVSERAFHVLDELESKLNELEAAGLDDPDRYHSWEVLHATFEMRGGYARRARRDAVLDALGFKGRYEQAVETLSGGERTRLGLARILMAQPEVLLLDEPTNHLDLDMRAWLESYLGRYPGAVIIVSHDRAFLDASCSRTAEVSRAELRSADGNPTTYRAARAEAERIQAATRANQEKEHQRIAAAAAQMKKWAGQSEKLHRRAKSMERRADRYERQMVDELAGPERTTRFTFDCDESGEIVLTARHLTKSFAKRLFTGVDLELRRGARVALVGPNGAGKTTLLRMLLGEERSDDPRGEVRTGARVRLGYYDQQLRGVNPEATLFEELLARVGNVEAHNLLGRFMFPYDAQFKKVKDLSGGERARLALLILTMGRYNLLVLDEPTNHLDLEMIEALEAALAAYQGTLLLVSHDRSFLSSLADDVWEVRGGSFTAYGGDFEHYLRRRARGSGEGGGALSADPYSRQAPSTGVTPNPPQSAGPVARQTPSTGVTPNDPQTSRQQPSQARGTDPHAGMSRWQLERRQEYLEARITELEEELLALTEGLSDPERALDLLDARPEKPDGPRPTPAQLVAKIGKQHEDTSALLSERVNEWERVVERLEAP